MKVGQTTFLGGPIHGHLLIDKETKEKLDKDDIVSLKELSFTSNKIFIIDLPIYVLHGRHRYLGRGCDWTKRRTKSTELPGGEGE